MHIYIRISQLLRGYREKASEGIAVSASMPFISAPDAEENVLTTPVANTAKAMSDKTIIIHFLTGISPSKSLFPLRPLTRADPDEDYNKENDNDRNHYIKLQVALHLFTMFLCLIRNVITHKIASAATRKISLIAIVPAVTPNRSSMSSKNVFIITSLSFS